MPPTADYAPSRPEGGAMFLFILLLALLSDFPPLATDIYLPAIPHLTPEIFLLFHRGYGWAYRF